MKRRNFLQTVAASVTATLGCGLLTQNIANDTVVKCTDIIAINLNDTYSVNKGTLHVYEDTTIMFHWRPDLGPKNYNISHAIYLRAKYGGSVIPNGRLESSSVAIAVANKFLFPAHKVVGLCWVEKNGVWNNTDIVMMTRHDEDWYSNSHYSYPESQGFILGMKRRGIDVVKVCEIPKTFGILDCIGFHDHIIEMYPC